MAADDINFSRLLCAYANFRDMRMGLKKPCHLTGIYYLMADYYSHMSMVCILYSEHNSSLLLTYYTLRDGRMVGTSTQLPLEIYKLDISDPVMFLGLFRKKENELSTISPLQMQRTRQIETLKNHNQNVTEIIKDIEYRITFSSGYNTLNLDVALPTHFPSEKPLVRVSPPVQHPWVNEEQLVVGCPSLNNFSMHSELGKVISELIQEFKTRVPVVGAAAPLPPLCTYQFGKSLHNVGVPLDISSTKAGVSSLSLSLETITTRLFDVDAYTYPELKDLSLSELQEMKDDPNDEKLIEFVDHIPLVHSIHIHLENIALQNEGLAKQNLDKEPEIEELKRSVLERIDQVSKLKMEFDDQMMHYQELSEQYAPSRIQENLKIAALQAEEDSELHAVKFLDGKITADEFLECFMDKRRLYHLRRMKEEKLHQQLLELKRSTF